MAIERIENVSALANEIHNGDQHYERRFFGLLSNGFQTNADLLKEKYPELSELRGTCAESCKNIHKVLNGDNSKAPDRLTEYVENIRTLDYTNLSELIKHIRFEYFNTTPREATDAEIMAYYKSLSPAEQEAKVGEVKDKIRIGKIMQEELTTLYQTVQNMKTDFPDVQVSRITENKEDESNSENKIE